MIDTLRLLVSKRILSRFLSRINQYVLLGLVVMIGVFWGLGMIFGSQWMQITIGCRGRLRVDGVGVYRDQNCSVVVRYLDWGTVEPGSAQDISLYVRNEGNHGATLFMITDNWNPTNASSYMSLSWNYDGKMLNPMDTAHVTLTLSLSPNVENIVDFSFDIVIGTNA